MDKEKEIEEMACLLSHECESGCRTCSILTEWGCCDYDNAEMLFNAGYRKADEVRKETAKEILCYLKATITDGLLKNHEILNALMKEYDIEVDE